MTISEQTEQSSLFLLHNNCLIGWVVILSQWACFVSHFQGRDANQSQTQQSTSSPSFLKLLVHGIRNMLSTTPSSATDSARKSDQKTPKGSSMPGNTARAFSQSQGCSPENHQGQQFQRQSNDKQDPNKTKLVSSRQEGDPPATPCADKSTSTQESKGSIHTNVHVVSHVEDKSSKPDLDEDSLASDKMPALECPDPDDDEVPFPHHACHHSRHSTLPHAKGQQANETGVKKAAEPTMTASFRQK